MKKQESENLKLEAKPFEPLHRPAHLLLRGLWEVASTIVPAVLVVLFLNVFVVQARTIDGPSMQPNLYAGQFVMTEKLTYRFLHGPRRGDIVLIDMPGEEIPLVKRVVALPGEEIEIQRGQVYVAGRPLEEPWATRLGGPDQPLTRLPPLHVFVLGDNRPNSRDSRSFGPVAVDQLLGRALFVYWPPDQIRLLSPR